MARRTFGATEDAQESAGGYASQDDRDAALESRYRIPCVDGCCTSLLAAIAVHGDELMREYMAWVSHQGADALDPKALAVWEVERFGDRAYRSAHGVLRARVREARFGSLYRRIRRPPADPKLTPGLSSGERKDRMLDALGSWAEKREMRDVPTADEWEDRRAELLDEARP